MAAATICSDLGSLTATLGTSYKWDRLLILLFRIISCSTVSSRIIHVVQFSSVQFSLSVVSNSLPPQESQHASHQLPEFTQTHIRRVGDAIQPSDPLSSPSPPALNLSQHQGLFKWVRSSHEVAKILEFQLQHQSFQWTPRTDFL